MDSSDNTSLPKWQVKNSEYVINTKWLKVRADTCHTPQGDLSEPWYVIEYPEWVNCVAIDQQDNVIVFRHYRHGSDTDVTEVVGGTVAAKDTTPQQAIIRELRDEIGYEGGQIYQTGVTYANPSNQNNKVFSFLAIGGECSGQVEEEVGEDFLTEKVPFKDFAKAMTDPASKIMSQSLHLASIFFALNYIRNTASPSEQILRLRKQLN